MKNKFQRAGLQAGGIQSSAVAAMKAEKAGAKTLNIEEAKKYKKDEAAGDGTDETGKPGSTTGGGTSRAPAALVRTVAAHRRALAAQVRIPATPARIPATATM